GALLLHEPGFVACVVIVAIAFGILFLGGLDWRLLIGLGFPLPVALWLMIRFAPYRLQRFTGFLDPWSDPLGKGYQLTHSLIAFGRGEWLGVGLGASVEKLLYLPEAHTDFLLAVVAEELGFAGVTLVVVLFAWLLVRAYAIGRQAARLERPFSALVAHGIGFWLGTRDGIEARLVPQHGVDFEAIRFGGVRGKGLKRLLLGPFSLLLAFWQSLRVIRRRAPDVVLGLGGFASFPGALMGVAWGR